MRCGRWPRLGCGAFALLSSAQARAAEPTAAPSTYALSWVRAEGAEDCPTGRVVAAEVERRLGRAVFDVNAERSFEVEVTRFGKTYRSDVFVRDAAGKTVGHRMLESVEPGCSALVNATSLAIALVIDPDAATREPAPGSSVAAFEAPPPPLPAPAPPPPPLPAPAPAPPAPQELRLPAPLPPSRTVSLRAQLTAGLVADTSPGFELAVTGRPGVRWGYALAASYTLSQTASRGIGSLDLGLTRASVLLTFDAARSEKVRLVLAAGPSLGALHVAVRRPAPVIEPGDFWFAAAQLGAGLQISVNKDFFVELGGAGFVPFTRQSFLVQDQTDPVFRQPLLFGLGFLGVGATFP
jgi:hypothetical protein